MPPEVLQRDLNLLSPVLHASEFYVVGGEPLLHPELETILDVVNASPIGDSIILSTNGKLLPKMSDAIYEKIDSLRLSIYPNLDTDIPMLAKQKCDQFGVLYQGQDVAKFWKQFALSMDGSSFIACPWKDLCLTVHDGWLFRCPESAFFPALLGWHSEPPDGYRLLPMPITETSLKEFLDRKEPLFTCRFCRGYTEQMDWHECASAEDWLKESTI